jgi:hypothetical protein
MSIEDKKMPFYGICRGEFAKEVQNLFEEAQVECYNRRGTVKVTATIVLYAPNADDDHFGGIPFETKMTLPPNKSPKYTTRLRDGVVISDGKDINECLGHLQMRLDLPPCEPDTTTVPFKPAVANDAPKA